MLFVEDHPIFCREPLRGNSEFFRRKLHQDVPGLCRSLSQGGTEIFGAARADRAPIVGAEGRVSHDHLDAVQPYIQFLGQHLRQRGDDPLSHLDLAGKTGDQAVLTDPEIGI